MRQGGGCTGTGVGRPPLADERLALTEQNLLLASQAGGLPTPRIRPSILISILLIILLCSFTEAATLKILEAERLELRNENGEELIILTGTPVKLDRGGELIEAPKVIYNRTRKRLMLSGGVRYKDKQGQVIQADDLDLDTSDESFEAISVKIESGEFYLTGPICERAAGQILLQKGYLTPCQRCAQNTPDYAFEANEVVLYPGDRIIARGVWVLLRGEKVLYLPAMLLYLSERRPKLEVGSTDTDGAYVFADLPYVSDFGLGYTFLRYFENRGWGIGFDHFGVGAAKERYQFLYLPAIALPEGSTAPTATSDGIWVYNLQYQLDNPDWHYSASIKRDDLAGTTSPLGDPFPSFGGQVDYTEFKLEAATQTNLPGAAEPFYRLTLDGYIDHNKTLGRTPRSTPQRLPEVEVSFPRGYQNSSFSINGSVQLGFYEAPSNPFNRTARNTPYLAAGRLQLVHNETYTLTSPPWPGLGFSLSNNFKGIYYTTRNSQGELERLINWQTNATLSQTLGPVKFGLNFQRNTIEGGTPFAFDFPGRTTRTTYLTGTFDYAPDPAFSFSAKATRDLENRVFDPLATFTLRNQPWPWFSLTNTVSRDIQNGKWGLLSTNLSLTPQPFSFTLSYTRNLELGLNGALSTRIAYSPLPWSFSASTGYRWSDVQEKETRPLVCDPATPFNCVLQYNRYDPLQLSASYNPENLNTSLQHSRDLNTGQAISTLANFLWREGDSTFTLSQTLNHLYFPLPQPGTTFTPTPTPFGLSGSAQLTLGLNTLRLSDSVVFGNPELPGLTGAGTANLALVYQYGTDTSLTLQGTWYYLQRLVKNPTLTFQTAIRNPDIFINQIYAQYHLPEADDPATPNDENMAYLQTLRFQGEAEIFPAPLRKTDPPGLAFQGSLVAERQTALGSGRFLLTLQNFGPTFSFMGEENTRLFLSLLYNTSGTNASQVFYLPNLENTILRPKVVVTIDRCCWALQGSLDTLNNEFKVSFIVGGSAADLLFNQNGFRFNPPSLNPTTGGTR